jgi:hypothetical protein
MKVDIAGWVLEKALPADSRDLLRALREVQGARGSRKLFTLETLSTIASIYWTRARTSLDRWSLGLLPILVVYCFGWAVLGWQLALLIGSVLGAVWFRDMYTHRDESSDRRAFIQHSFDSVGDGVAAMVFVIAGQAAAFALFPSLAVPKAVLFRGMSACLPLIVILQMYSRQKPLRRPGEFQHGDMTAEEIHRRVWRLDMIWVVMFVAFTVENFTDIPHHTPDVLRGLSITLLGVWRAVQASPFGNRVEIQTLFTDPRDFKLRRLIRTLPQGLVKGEPLYFSHLLLEAVIFGGVGMNLAEPLWPWLSEQGGQVEIVRAIGSIIAFATCVLSWQYVKQANRAAAQAIESEVRSVF